MICFFYEPKKVITMRLTLIVFFLSTFLYLNSQNFSTFINELNYAASNPIERGLEIAGETGSSLEDWSLVYYSLAGTIAYVEYLSGVLPNQSGGYGFGWYEVNQSSNGGGIALVNSSGGLVQFISYGTASYLQATEGPATGVVAEFIGVQLSPSQSLQLTGTGLSYLDFVWGLPGTNNPGQINTNQVFSLLFRNDEDSSGAEIEEEVLTMNFTVFPNPTVEQVQLSFPEIMRESATLEVFTINGQLLQQQVLKNGASQINIDLSTYQSGQYLLVLTKGKTRTTKLVVKS